MVTKKEMLNRLKANSALKSEDLTKEEKKVLNKLIDEGLAKKDKEYERYAYQGKYLKYHNLHFIDRYCDFKGWPLESIEISFETAVIENVSDETFKITFKCDLKNSFFILREVMKNYVDESLKVEKEREKGLLSKEEYFEKCLRICKKYSANTYILPPGEKMLVDVIILLTKPKEPYYVNLYIDAISQNHHEFFKIEGEIYLIDRKKRRIEELIKKILKMDPEKDKLKIQDVLKTINDIFATDRRDGTRKKLQKIFQAFEAINPAWTPVSKLQMKIIHREKVESGEWLVVAKRIMQSVLKKELNLQLASYSLYSLLRFAEYENTKIDPKIKVLFMHVKSFSKFGSIPKIDEHPKVLKVIKETIEKIDKLMQEFKD